MNPLGQAAECCYSEVADWQGTRRDVGSLFESIFVTGFNSVLAAFTCYQTDMPEDVTLQHFGHMELAWLVSVEFRCSWDADITVMCCVQPYSLVLVSIVLCCCSSCCWTVWNGGSRKVPESVQGRSAERSWAAEITWWSSCGACLQVMIN